MNEVLRSAFESDALAFKYLEEFNIQFADTSKGLLTFPFLTDAVIPRRGALSTVVAAHEAAFKKINTLLWRETQLVTEMCRELSLESSVSKFISSIEKYGKITLISPRGCLFFALLNPKTAFFELREKVGLDGNLQLSPVRLLRELGLTKAKEVKHPTSSSKKTAPAVMQPDIPEVGDMEENISPSTLSIVEINPAPTPAVEVEPSPSIVRGKGRKLNIYTDASVYPEQNLTVLAAYAPTLKEAVVLRLPLLVSAFEAERQAVGLGLRTFEDVGCVFTDNADVAREWMRSQAEASMVSKDEVALRDDVLTLTSPREVVVRYVAREENGVADKLCRMGRKPEVEGHWKVAIDGKDVDRKNGWVQLITPLGGQSWARSAAPIKTVAVQAEVIPAPAPAVPPSMVEQAAGEIQMVEKHIEVLTGEIEVLKNQIAEKEAQLNNFKEGLEFLREAQEIRNRLNKHLSAIVPVQ